MASVSNADLMKQLESMSVTMATKDDFEDLKRLARCSGKGSIFETLKVEIDVIVLFLPTLTAFVFIVLGVLLFWGRSHSISIFCPGVLYLVWDVLCAFG